MEIKKIVITGGPCGGKSSAFKWIKDAFENKGYTVLFIPETATEFITGGVAPWTCGTNLDYQKCQMELQITKERLFLRAAQSMKKDKILIVCDRGALDNKVYMNNHEFNEVLDFLNLDEYELIHNYDAIYHLVSAAKGAEAFYTIDNNTARTETIEEAALMDDKFINAWSKHPHLTIIDNSTDFENKMKRLIDAISNFIV